MTRDLSTDAHDRVRWLLLLLSSRLRRQPAPVHGTMLIGLVLSVLAMTAAGSSRAVAMPRTGLGRGAGPASVAAAVVGTCPLTSRYVRLFDEQPARGVTVLLLKTGASAVTDEQGQWWLDVPDDRQVTVRVVAPTTLIDVVDDMLIPEGITDVTYHFTRCTVYAVDFNLVSRTEGPVSRPPAPPVPAGFLPSEATRAAMAPALPTLGNATNVSWAGAFWLTAPLVTVGVCGAVDAATQESVDSAVQRWNESAALGLGWTLVRDDQACDAGYARPRALIRHEAFSQSRGVVRRLQVLGVDGSDCHIDPHSTRMEASGRTCWVGSVVITLNPAGYDRLSPDRKLFTVVHELGHALGLAQAHGCGASVMWHDIGGCSGPPTRPGPDDVASLNDLLAETLRALQAPPTTQPAATTPAMPNPAAPAAPADPTAPVEPTSGVP